MNKLSGHLFLLFILFFSADSLHAQVQQRMLYFKPTELDERHPEVNFEALLYHSGDARNQLIRFLNEEYRLHEFRYTTAAISVNPDRMDDRDYRDSFFDFADFLLENGFGHVHLLYQYDGDLENSGKVADFFENLNDWLEAEQFARYFSHIHLDVRPHHHPDFKGIENRHVNANQPVYEAVIDELSGLDQRENLPVPLVLDVDADAFFGLPATMVFSRQKSLGLILAGYADLVNVRVQRDFAAGNVESRDGSRYYGMVMTMRPIFHALQNRNKRVMITIESSPYRHPQLGSRATFYDQDGFRDQKSGRRDLDREIDRFLNQLTQTERSRLEKIGIANYSYFRMLRP